MPLPSLHSDIQEGISYWLEQGYGLPQAIAIESNIFHESGGRADAVGDGGAAHGLVQMHPDRRARIYDATGIDMSTASAMDQRRGIAWEMQNEPIFDDGVFRQYGDAGAAAAYFSSHYERPADEAGEASARAATADAIYANIDDLGALGKAFRIQQEVGNTQFTMLSELLLEDEATDVGSFAGTLQDVPAYAVHPSLSYLRGKMGLDDAALASAGIDVAAYRAERGEVPGLTAEQTQQGIKDAKYIKDGDTVLDVETSTFGPESQKVAELLKTTLAAMKDAPAGSPEQVAYAKMVAEITAEVERKQAEAQASDAERRRINEGLASGAIGGVDSLDELLSMAIMGVVLGMIGGPELANSVLGGGRAGGTSNGVGGTGGGSVERINIEPDGSTPGAEVAQDAVMAADGNPPKAFIFHHTGGRGDVNGVISTLNQRGLGVQYVMDRNGEVYKIGGAGESHIRDGQGVGEGLSNSNVVGMEIIANDDGDITPQQVEAAMKFIAKYYPDTPVYGHGEINGHKQRTEGQTVVTAIREARRAGDMPMVAEVAPEGLIVEEHDHDHGAPESGSTEPVPTGANLMQRGGQYGNPGEHLTTVSVDVSDGKGGIIPGGGTITLHSDAAPAFTGFINELVAMGAPITVEDLRGHVDRNQYGTSTISQHAFGNAIDLGQRDDAVRDVVTPPIQAWSDKNMDVIWAAQTRWNISSGGDFSNPDFGHFEWRGKPVKTGGEPTAAVAAPETPQAAATLASSEEVRFSHALGLAHDALKPGAKPDSTQTASNAGPTNEGNESLGALNSPAVTMVASTKVTQPSLA